MTKEFKFSQYRLDPEDSAYEISKLQREVNFEASISLSASRYDLYLRAQMPHPLAPLYTSEDLGSLEIRKRFASLEELNTFFSQQINLLYTCL